MSGVIKSLLTMPIRRRERRHPQRSHQGGMALIEVLVALLIFSFGVIGLIGLEASAIHFSVDAEDRNRATLFANDIASTMWLTGTVVYYPCAQETAAAAAQYATWQANIKNLTLPTGLPKGTLNIAQTGTTTNSVDITIQWTPTTDPTATTRQLTTRVIL
jgi:type IV pilus assembly protein PilV